jgi:hypothetical protein
MSAEPVTVWFAKFGYGGALIVESIEGTRTPKQVRLHHSSEASGFRTTFAAGQCVFTRGEALARLRRLTASSVQQHEREAALGVERLAKIDRELAS